MRVLFVLVLVVFLSGCFGVRVPETPGFPGPGSDSAGGLLNTITYWAIGAASVGIFASIVLAVFGGNTKLAGRLAATCIAVLIAGPVLLWVGSNLWWISLLCALVGGAAYLWAHRKYLEKHINKDLDGDGVIYDVPDDSTPRSPGAETDTYAPHTEEGAK